MSMTIGELERRLLLLFPAEDAEAWDRTGLLVGDPAAEVQRVATALDPTVQAVKEAAHRGANVLLTHHPVFLDPPPCFLPHSSGSSLPGAVVYEAIRQGVALMAFHTALDVNPAAHRVLPEALGLRFERVLLPLPSDDHKGYGQVCRAAEPKGVSLRELAFRAARAFGRSPRVWGDASHLLSTVVTCTGSVGGVAEAARAIGADCVVCGEVKYHAALEYLQQGLSLVELGHDASENGLADVLTAVLSSRCGLDTEKAVRLDLGDNWWLPDRKGYTDVR